MRQNSTRYGDCEACVVGIVLLSEDGGRYPSRLGETGPLPVLDE